MKLNLRALRFLKLYSPIVASAMVLALQGCSTLGIGERSPGAMNASDTSIPPPKSLNDVLSQGGSSSKLENIAIVHDGEISVRGMKLKNTKFDIPITMNSRVEFWVNYFCGRGRPFFTKYLERSEFFIPYIVPLLQQNRMPEDLVYLAMIESGFNNLARSRARAVGPWQFIAATGKRYGLAVNWWVDERRDIRKSTLAAVEYLRDLYNMFHSWELAAAAYNAGESKVARAVRRFGTHDFWAIARQRFLKPETRDYVPKMIAAAIISKNRTQFGFVASGLKPGAGEAIAGDGAIVKVVQSDKPELDASQYQADRAQEGVAGGGDVKLDSEYAAEESADNTDDDQAPNDAGPEVASQKLEPSQPLKESLAQAEIPNPIKVDSIPLAKPIQTPHVSKTGEVGGEELLDFEVQSPADLLKIARAAGLSYQTVKSLNPEVLRWCTPPSASVYRIKIPSSVKDKFLATYNHDAYPRKVEFMTYKVHRGETVANIANHFGIKVDPIADLNRVSKGALLKHGAKVLLPMPNDRSRTFSSLEVRDPPERRSRRRSHRSRHRARGNKTSRAVEAFSDAISDSDPKSS